MGVQDTPAVRLAVGGVVLQEAPGSRIDSGTECRFRPVDHLRVLSQRLRALVSFSGDKHREDGDFDFQRQFTVKSVVMKLLQWQDKPHGPLEQSWASSFLFSST